MATMKSFLTPFSLSAQPSALKRGGGAEGGGGGGQDGGGGGGRLTGWSSLA